MIPYSQQSWIDQVFRFRGTVWSSILGKVLFVTAYVLAAYLWCSQHGMNLGKMRSNILGSTLSFLLVFRANNAYARYWQGSVCLTDFFYVLREFASLGIVFLHGGRRDQHWRWRLGLDGMGINHQDYQPHDGLKDPARRLQYLGQPDSEDLIASEERTDVVRWALVLAIALQLHTRMLDEGFNNGSMSGQTKWLVDWDRFRIRSLTTRAEFVQIDRYVRSLAIPQTAWASPTFETLEGGKELFSGSGPPEGWPDEIEISTVPTVKMPTVVLYRLNQILYRNMNDMWFHEKPYGISERLMPVFTALSEKLNQVYGIINQIVLTPLPFPYFHLCKTLLITYFLAFPFLIQQELGFWANVGEFFGLAIALLGVDAIATELENPFGNDANDLDVYEKIAGLEEELMFFLGLCGDERCKANFIKQPMPPEMTKYCPSPVTTYVALRSQVESGGKSNTAIYGSKVTKETRKSAKNTHSVEAQEVEEDGSGSDSS